MRVPSGAADLARPTPPRRRRRGSRCRSGCRARASAARSATPTRSTAAPRRGSRACGWRRDRPRVAILLVAWRSSASRASSGAMPSPSSSTRTSFLPPSSMVIAMRRAPASRAFSTSSLTTEAGRSTTSPAAIWLARSGGSWRISVPRRDHRYSDRLKNQSISADDRGHDADDPPELRRLAARKVAAASTFMPAHAGQHGQRQEDRRDDRQHLHHLVQPIATCDRCASSSAGDAILKQHRLVGHPHEVIVDVAEAVRHSPRSCANSRRASRPTTSRCGVTTRRSDATSRLSAEDLADVVLRRARRRRRSSSSSSRVLELLDLRPVVVDHRVDDAVEQRRRPLAEHVVVARTDVAQLRRSTARAVVDRDQVVARRGRSRCRAWRSVCCAAWKSMPCRIR